MLTSSHAHQALSAFADPDAVANNGFRTGIFLMLLFSVLLLGFVVIAVLSLPIECIP